VVSALPPKADMCGAQGDVRFVPIADMCSAQADVRLWARSGHQVTQSINSSPYLILRKILYVIKDSKNWGAGEGARLGIIFIRGLKPVL
jgi:hypothetical protein